MSVVRTTVSEARLSALEAGVLAMLEAYAMRTQTAEVEAAIEARAREGARRGNRGSEHAEGHGGLPCFRVCGLCTFTRSRDAARARLRSTPIGDQPVFETLSRRSRSFFIRLGSASFGNRSIRLPRGSIR